MPTLTYPGVYIQEISSGVRPIAIASTSTAAFVGLAQSVLQFFNNGGQQCYIVRVMRSDAATADVTVQNRANPATDAFCTDSPDVV